MDPRWLHVDHLSLRPAGYVEKESAVKQYLFRVFATNSTKLRYVIADAIVFY